jgi:hypothetical protein
MMFLRHISRALWATVCYSAAQRRITLLLVVVLGLLLISLALASQAATPFVLYPFA